MRRIDDDIRTLCARLLATKSDDQVRPIVVELRAALRTQIGRLRRHLARYPYVVERRARRISPSGIAAAVASISERNPAPSQPLQAATPHTTPGPHSQKGAKLRSTAAAADALFFHPKRG